VPITEFVGGLIVWVMRRLQRLLSVCSVPVRRDK
jgi:hypothetical protein